MSFRVPDFGPEEGNPVFPRKIHESAGDDFVELTWQKGPFLRRRSPDPPHSDSALCFLSNPRAASGVSTHTAAAATSPPSTTELFMEEDEMASWLYYPLDGDDDPGGVGTVAGVNPTEQPREAAAALPEQGFFPPAVADRAVEADAWATSTGRPPRHPQTQGMSTCRLGAPLPPPASGESRVVSASATTTEPGSCRPGAESRVSSGDARVGVAACEHGPASSSGLSCDGEEAEAGAGAAGRRDKRKRRARDDGGCDSDSHSEDGEFESSGGKRRDSRRSASARRARAAHVHNLSERRRRDRINEKMKALQQLIPRCHKSDKASMLDDAIEYMKSLQMQVQMMSMCCNMTPMMFPGVQQYTPSVGMGMPMVMNMGMGVRMAMGMGMGMDLASGGLRHPMMPCPTVIPAAQMAANGAPHLTSQRLPVQAAHAPVAAFAEQIRLQASNQTDPASSSACIRTPGAMQMPNLPAVVHQGRSHNPASATEPGISKRTSMPDKSKLG